MSQPSPRIGVVIPTRNEAAAIPHVLGAMPPFVTAVAVGDYCSTDGTVEIARERGAIVVEVDGPGYGHACLAAIDALPPVDIIVFVDGDAADDLSEMAALVEPIVQGDADLVIGSRVTGEREAGALTTQQVFGNWLACWLVRLIWGVRFTDLGPFRAIERAAFDRLQMADRNYGWTVEMQVKAARAGLRCREHPVRYRRRIGISKVSGTLTGSLRAGCKILWVIAREGMVRLPAQPERAERR